MTPLPLAAMMEATQLPRGLNPAAVGLVSQGRAQPVGSKGSSLVQPVHLFCLMLSASLCTPLLMRQINTRSVDAGREVLPGLAATADSAQSPLHLLRLAAELLLLLLLLVLLLLLLLLLLMGA